MSHRNSASAVVELFCFLVLGSCFLTFASRVELSPTDTLAKRSLVMECPDDRIPKSPNPGGATHPLVSRFNTLHDLCSTYTTGMGIFCAPDGTLQVVVPMSSLYRGPPDSTYLHLACLTCHCVNIGPDDPEPSTPERPACVVDIGEDEVVGPVPSHPPNPQCNRFTEIPDEYRCNEYMYGRPLYADCVMAHDEIKKLEDALGHPAEFPAVFAGIGRMADAERMADLEGRIPYQLPVTFTNGTCTISIIQLERRFMDVFETEYWGVLEENAMTVITECVQTQGIGGWQEAGERNYSIPNPAAPMGLFVYGPDSRFQQLLDIKFACTTDAEGKADCQDTDDNSNDQGSSKKQKTGEWSAEGQGDAGQAGSSDPQPPATQRCEVPCSHPSDCDPNYLCTSDSPLPSDPPIDPSFRAFCCQLVTDLADSIAASQVLGPGNCRGRCLLANTTTNATTATNDSTWTNTTLDILARPDQPYLGSALECPCNCTYVSPACCLSTDGVVFEDATEKSDVGVRAPNGTVCCDGMTGDWKRAAVVRDHVVGNPACPSTPSGATGLELVNT